MSDLRTNLVIPEEVLRYFASDPIGPMLNLRYVVDEAASPICNELDSFLENIPPETVAEVRMDRHFLSFPGKPTEIDRDARIWIAARWLSNAITDRRLQYLRDDANLPRPTPYDVAALTDLEVDSEHLVRLSEFRYDGSRLLRNGVAFSTLLTQGSTNSNYWLQEALYSTGTVGHVKVRIDPLLFREEEEFPATMFKMTMYGRTLDWDRIGRLREPEHGSWFSELRNTVTEYCWTPRGREVSFVCEEVPMADSSVFKACRYLHAIYRSDASVIIHLDGALRVYSRDEIEARKKQHVRITGKSGLRAKVFRVDDLIPREHLSLIAQTFFVWNQDVQHYFAEEIAVSN